jgi:imidazolonepropionase-like amidohydrolase
MITNRLATLLIGAAFASAALAQKPVVITGGKLLTVSHGTIEDGVLVLQGGKIAAVGKVGAVSVPRDATVIDAKGMTVYPGLIDPDTTLGMVEVGSDKNARDLNESSDEIMPHMHVADAFHAETVLIPVARLNGVTNAAVAPGTDDSLSGQDAFIQLAGKDRDAMILSRDAALSLNFGAEQRRRGAKAAYPGTRMGLITQLRQSLLDAQQYEASLAADAKKPKKEGETPAPAKRDLKLEALLPYLHGEKPVVVQVTEAYEAETVMKVAQEFHLKVVLKGMTRTQDIVDEVASWKVPVIFGPIYELPRPDERFDAVFSMPAQLAKRGVKVALMSSDAVGASTGPGSNFGVRNLPYAAGFAAAYGLPYDEALKAVTLNVAEIYGVADKLGSLDVGKTANVVIANGDPLDVRTDVKQVFIEGVSQPMVSRQTQLRDEYSK